MIYKGFKFAILLQIAVGPVCIFLFQTAANNGLLLALSGVVGVALVDALFILLAIFGIGAIINKYSGAKKILTYFGTLILILFGLSIILETFGKPILPSFSLLSSENASSVFLKTIILTLSNPLTILFWAGVFSTKITENNMDRKDMYLFGIGAILSTLFFLSLIAFIGSIATKFLSRNILDMLNIAVGLLLVFFGVRSVVKSKAIIAN